MSEVMTMPPLGEIPVKRTPTVYFIDDSATMREVIKIALRRENFNVITCADAASALAQFDQNRPDVVITDVIMPDQDGYSVCSQIKQHPEFGGVPVVLMSGVVNKSVADKAVAVKADELIRKPFQPQELIGRVKHLLAPNDAVAAPQPPRERKSSYALENLFSPPPSTIPRSPAQQPPAPHMMPPFTPGALHTDRVLGPQAPSASAPSAQAEAAAWPRALADAFTPVPPFSAGAPAQSRTNVLQPVAPISTQAPVSPAATSQEAAKLRGEIARVELLVKKLQTELQLERDYNQALEKQIRALLALS